MENISFAATFRGDSPLYPNLISVHRLFGFSELDFSLLINSIALIFVSLFMFWTLKELKLNTFQSILSVLIWLMSVHVLKYYTSPISYSLHGVWIAFVVMIIVKFESKSIQMSYRNIFISGIFSGLAVINNYAAIAYIGLISFFIFIRNHKIKAVFYSLISIGPLVILIINNEIGVAKEVLPGNIFKYPLLETGYFFIRAIFPFQQNYLLSCLLSFFALYLLALGFKNRQLKILLSIPVYFLFVSLCIYLFVDHEAIINYKRVQNISYPSSVLIFYVLFKEMDVYKKIIVSLALIQSLTTFIFYQKNIYSNGPRFNEYSLEKSTSFDFVRENFNNEKLIFFTNNSPTAYMHFRKRINRTPLLIGDNLPDFDQEVQRLIENGKDVYFLEFTDSDGRHVKIDKLGQGYGFELVYSEKLVKLIKAVRILGSTDEY